MTTKDAARDIGSANDPGFGWFSVLAVVVVFVGTGAMYLLRARWGFDRSEAADTIGVVFEALAIAGVVFAIVLQRNELRQQREELRLTRDEVAGQREEMEQQNATLRQQTFENSFYQLLRFLREIVDTLRARPGSSEYEGRAAFRAVAQDLINRSGTLITLQRNGAEPEQIRNEAGKHFRSLCARAESDFGSYFRSLHRSLLFVEQSAIANESLYADVVRAQLSQDEQTLILFSVMSEGIESDFTRLVQRYELLRTYRPHENLQLVLDLI